MIILCTSDTSLVLDVHLCMGRPYRQNRITFVLERDMASLLILIISHKASTAVRTDLFHLRVVFGRLNLINLLHMIYRSSFSDLLHHSKNLIEPEACSKIVVTLQDVQIQMPRSKWNCIVIVVFLENNTNHTGKRALYSKFSPESSTTIHSRSRTQIKNYRQRSVEILVHKEVFHRYIPHMMIAK